MEGVEESLKLHGYWASPYAIRVIWALKLKGINNYDYIEENILEKKSPQLLQYNPVYKKVPIFVHNGKPISESLVIIEYIDEFWNHHPRLLPRDPYECAQARFWAKYADEKCVPAIRGIYSAAVKGEAEKAAEEAKGLLKVLERGLEGRRFFGGEEIGFADIAVGWLGLWGRITGEIVGVNLIDDEKELPILSAFFNEFYQIPLIRDCLPPHDKLLELNMGFFRKMLPEKPN